MSRNLCSLDELDTIDEKERQEREEAEYRTITSDSVSASSDLISDPGFALLLDPNNLF